MAFVYGRIGTREMGRFSDIRTSRRRVKFACTSRMDFARDVARDFIEYDAKVRESPHLIETPYAGGFGYWAGIGFLRRICVIGRNAFLFGERFPG